MAIFFFGPRKFNVMPECDVLSMRPPKLKRGSGGPNLGQLCASLLEGMSLQVELVSSCNAPRPVRRTATRKSRHSCALNGNFRSRKSESEPMSLRLETGPDRDNLPAQRRRRYCSRTTSSPAGPGVAKRNKPRLVTAGMAQGTSCQSTPPKSKSSRVCRSGGKKRRLCNDDIDAAPGASSDIATTTLRPQLPTGPSSGPSIAFREIANCSGHEYFPTSFAIYHIPNITQRRDHLHACPLGVRHSPVAQYQIWSICMAVFVDFSQKDDHDWRAPSNRDQSHSLTQVLLGSLRPKMAPHVVPSHAEYRKIVALMQLAKSVQP
ncbi:hypothetical protein CCHR01_02309 [Colletotrichum chrysophilum]|uniref:Uncharacterized protein n=1 Tax=Colletotrichum chrysophilum TaxID=1836956 RepID=A0AAD9AX86_9PEZI|nr:hypothetical protein CCHR01_02309 [Colletotrichum chrysophilum]